MNPLDFAAAILALGPDAAFRLMNAARPPADYLFATFLPEILKATYFVRAGSMTLRTTMAGLVGMDSPYPPTSVIEQSDFKEGTAKVANSVTLTEEALRELQALLSSLGTTGAGNDTVQNTLLNFQDKLITQAHLDTAEWLRGQALVTGAISWTFNRIVLSVNYGVPAGNFLTNRTGTDYYGGTTSKFWADMRTLSSKLKGQVRAYLAHPDTINLIVSNDVNKVRVIAQDNVSGTFTIGRLIGSTERESSDARDRLMLIAYGAEGETLDPANPGKTKLVPFLPTGKVVAIGNPIPRGFQVGQGSTENPNNALPIGYTHVGPTVEGNGRPGRWARVYTPEGQPWQLRGEGVTNIMPVIQDPNKISVASTDMS